MTRSTAPPADPPCPSSEPLYRDFDEKIDDPRLNDQQDRLYVHLLRILDIGMDEPRLSVRTVVSKYFDGFFGQYLSGLLSASFGYVSYLKSLISSRRTGQLSSLVRNWHRYLREAVSISESLVQEAGKYVLIGFNIVEDSSTTLRQEDFATTRQQGASEGLVLAVAREAGLSPDQALRKAKERAVSGKNGRGKPLEKEAEDVIDVLASVLLLMKRPGLKPVVSNAKLQAWLIDKYFASRTDVESLFGGAAGNELIILRYLNFPVLLHTPYHNQKQAELAEDCAKRLEFDEHGAVQPFRSVKPGDSEAARKLSFVFQLTPEVDEQGRIVGPSVTIEGETFLPQGADRVIFQIINSRTKKAALWETLRVEWKDAGPSKRQKPKLKLAAWDEKKRCWYVEIPRDAKHSSGKKVFDGFSNNDWPWLPIFQHRPKLDKANKVLTIELASADEMKPLAGKIQTVLLGGLQRLGDRIYNEALTELLGQALIGQLKALSGVPVQVELSGVASARVLENLKQLFHKAGIDHLGINREELAQITSQPIPPYYVWPRPLAGESAFITYQRAEHFLREFDSRTLYVHDLELDLLLRRNPPKELPHLTLAALERHRQAMLLAKVAVPVGLLKRAKVRKPWNWEFVLSGPSLMTVMAFADEYARMIAARVAPLSEEDKKEQFERTYQEVFDSLLENGYYQHPEPGGISVVLAPAIYVPLPKEVSLSGAGDKCFAVHGAMSSRN